MATLLQQSLCLDDPSIHTYFNPSTTVTSSERPPSQTLVPTGQNDFLTTAIHQRLTNGVHIVGENEIQILNFPCLLTLIIHNQ